MSLIPHFFVEGYDQQTNKYHLLHPITPYNKDKDKDKYNFVDLFPYRYDYNLFSVIEKENTFPEMKGIKTILPADTCIEIAGAYQQVIDYHPIVYWFTYADMYIYILEHPKVMEEYDDVPIENPLIHLKERIDAFLEVFDKDGIWHDHYTDIRIVCWFD